MTRLPPGLARRLGFSLLTVPLVLLATAYAQATTVAGEAVSQPAWPQAVATQLLDEQRARALPSTVQLSENQSHIDLQDNQVLGYNYGFNSVEQGAFEGAHGISTVIQNTGHNVAIQESMNINVVFNP